MTGRKKNSKLGGSLHKRNRHAGRYDFRRLVEACPELKAFVQSNKMGQSSIDFSDSKAVKCLNRALLISEYGLSFWDIPEGRLCPPIPGRADMIHNLADVLAKDNGETVPQGKHVKLLDIGTGANCIYPIVGSCEYGWSFTASDIDKSSLENAGLIVRKNKQFKGLIDFRHQSNSQNIFKGIINQGESYAMTVCNPPFHSSAKEAAAGTERKLRNLGIARDGKKRLNFGGRSNELWCPGGERAFILRMIDESLKFSSQVLWFSTLVSKESSLPILKKSLQKISAKEIQILSMYQGQKVSRVLVWSFLDLRQRREWIKKHWK